MNTKIITYSKENSLEYLLMIDRYRMLKLFKRLQLVLIIILIVKIL
jgi:hypothetical protein